MTPSPATPSQTGRSRYPGTRPFRDTAADQAIFFGRDEEGEALYLRILSVPLVLQFAKSGLGKTSLLQAAVFPCLRQKPLLPVMVRLNDPAETLVQAVAHSIEQASDNEGLKPTIGQTDGLWELLSTTTVWRDDLLLTPVLVFDQFEEVFTLRDEVFRTQLALELASLVSGSAPTRLSLSRPDEAQQAASRPDVKIVISIREDYLGALQEFSAVIPSLFQERMRLEPLNERAARDAITKPALRMPAASEEPYWSPPFEFEPAALDGMITYLKGNSGVIEPFQLQLLCRHAEAIAKGKNDASGEPAKLDPGDFQGSQGFDAVLKNFYRKTIRQLDRKQRKRAAELCEVGLLDGSGHRLMQEEEQIRREFGVTYGSLARLARDRLLRRQRRLDSVFYEISHDRLAESIMRSKRFRLPKKMRRALLVAAIIVPIVLIFLGLLGVQVQQSRENAYGLVEFMQGNLQEELGAIGRSSLLDEVRRRAGTGGNLNEWASLNDGLRKRNDGDTKRRLGSIAESVKLFGQALEVFQSSPDTPTRQRELARTYDRLGDALGDEGEVTQALSNYESAIQAWRLVVKSASQGKSRDCTSLAESLISAGNLKRRLGDVKPALADLHEATRITTDVLLSHRTAAGECGDSGEGSEPHVDPRALEVASEGTLLHVQIASTQEDYEGSAALAVEAHRLDPSSLTATKQAFVALAWRGNGRGSTPQSALEDYRVVLREIEELLHREPDNRLWQRERAASQVLIAGAIAACQSSKGEKCKPMPLLEEADSVNLEALATLRALSSSDPNNASWLEDVGWALEERGKVLAAAGRHSERLASLEMAEPIFRGCQREKADTECTEKLGGLLLKKADAFLELGRLSEAKESLRRANDMFAGLVADHSEDLEFIGWLYTVRLKQVEVLRKAGETAAANVADPEVKRLLQKYRDVMASLQWSGQGLTDEVKHVNLGAERFNHNDYAAALREFYAAEAAGREFVSGRPVNYRAWSDVRNLYRWIGKTQEKLGSAQERTVALNAALHAAQVQSILAPESSRKEAKRELVDAWQEFAKSLYDSDSPIKALPMVQEEIVEAERLVQEDPQNAQYLWYLGNGECGLGMVWRRNDKASGWEEAIRSGLILVGKAAQMDAKRPGYLEEVGYWRKYLGDQLIADGRKEEATAEYRLALDTYQTVKNRFAKDQQALADANAGIQSLAEKGIR
jgi:tetratricopeptide (TPR) repeat protein